MIKCSVDLFRLQQQSEAYYKLKGMIAAKDTNYISIEDEQFFIDRSLNQSTNRLKLEQCRLNLIEITKSIFTKIDRDKEVKTTITDIVECNNKPFLTLVTRDIKAGYKELHFKGGKYRWKPRWIIQLDDEQIIDCKRKNMSEINEINKTTVIKRKRKRIPRE